MFLVRANDRDLAVPNAERNVEGIVYERRHLTIKTMR